MAKNSNPISETLKKIYPHWTEKQISDLTAHIFATYGNLIEKKGDDSAVLELLNMAIMEARKAYPNAEQVNPGLIRRILPQQLDRQNDKETKRIDNKTLEDAETFVNRASGRPDFDLDKYREKLDRLEKYVLRACGLTPTEEKLFRIWMEVVKRETKSDSDSIFGTKGISIDLMDELQDEVRNSGWDISNEYFRKLLSDIRGKLRIKKPEIGGLMSFITKEQKEVEDTVLALRQFLTDFLTTNQSSQMQIILSERQYEDLWNKHFKPFCKDKMPDYEEYRIAERMFEDYLDIFRGVNTRDESGDFTMPYPHPFFDKNGDPLLKEKPCIRFILVGEARPPQKDSDYNDCQGDKANTYFYNKKHIGTIGLKNGREYRNPTPWLNAPRLNWGCPPFQPCPNNKAQTLLHLASKGVLLLDLFPFAISFSTTMRNTLNKCQTTRSFWDSTANPFNLQDRIRRISKLLCDDWDLTMVAPCVISEYIVNPINLFPTLAIDPIGLHPRTFRIILHDNKRCISSNCGHKWKKIAVSQQAPSARLIGLSF